MKEGKEPVIQRRVGGTNISNVLYAFAKKVGTVVVVYMCGYFELSVAWLIGPVILSVIRDEWKKENEYRRNLAKATATTSEKEVILARVDDLPSWVFFPDVERVEWLNKIIKQVWPNVNHYARGILKDSIEPSIRDSLAAYKFSGFKFEKMNLGSIPPRIGGIKVYDKNVSRSEIILDMDIFYAGDCDISFTIGGIKGGIKDFQIHGMMRVVMKPLINQIPLVGGLQVFFLNNPRIDFNLVGVADLLDMPGLSDMLRRIIVEIIAGMMVLPNKFPIQLSEDVPAQILKTPEPEGVLRVHVVEAKDLMRKDIGVLGKGKSDPYAVINVGAQEFRTSIIDNTVNPKWDFWCEFVIEEKGQELNATLFDKDPGDDDFLGRATVDIHSVTKKGQVDMWVTLEDAKHGMVHLRMTWLSLSSDQSALKAALAETQLLRLTTLSTSLLILFIDSAKNLPSAVLRSYGQWFSSGSGKSARTSSRPDPYAQISIGKKQEITSVQYRTGDPVWEQGFTFLVNNPEADTLHIKVMDQKTGQEIGRLTYNLTTLLEKHLMEIDHQPFALKQSGPESKIVLSLQLKVLKYEEPKVFDSDDDDEDEDITNEKKPLVRPETPKKSEPVNIPGSSIVKQPSKESLQSSGSPAKSSPNTRHPVEELISTATTSMVEGADIRQRVLSNSSSSGEHGLGRIQFTLRYSVPRQRLVIVVHKIVNLPLNDPSNIPDPYVKLYLLPERSKDSKRKTETMKDNCNPVYDETFEYVISQGELNSRQLEVSVVTKKGWFSSASPVMGQAIVNLSDYDLSKAVTLWFDLQPEASTEA